MGLFENGPSVWLDPPPPMLTCGRRERAHWHEERTWPEGAREGDLRFGARWHEVTATGLHLPRVRSSYWVNGKRRFMRGPMFELYGRETRSEEVVL